MADDAAQADTVSTAIQGVGGLADDSQKLVRKGAAMILYTVLDGQQAAWDLLDLGHDRLESLLRELAAQIDAG